MNLGSRGGLQVPGSLVSDGELNRAGEGPGPRLQ